MAAGRNPEEERAIREAEQRRVVPGEPPMASRGSWGFGWWWVWVVLIIAAFYFAGWGWGGYGGWWWGGRRPGVVSSVTPGTNGVQNPYNTSATRPNNASTSNVANEQSSIGGYNGVTGNGLMVLEASNKQQFVGKTFAIQNAPVQSKVNNHVLWVGQTQSSRILVVEQKNGQAKQEANINAHRQNVDVNGTVKKAPTVAQAKKKWGLDETAAKQLEQQGVYVMASNVQPVQPLAEPVQR